MTTRKRNTKSLENGRRREESEGRTERENA